VLQGNNARLHGQSTWMAVLAGLSQACQDCHNEPAAHAGLFEQDCAACHTPQGWKPAQLDGQSFNHDISTGFSLTLHSLDYQGTPMNCQTCHGAGVRAAFEIQTCIDCHTLADQPFMQEHQAQFGSACLDGTVRVYVVSSDDLLILAHSRLTRSLRPEECQKYLHQETCP
jgi:hypothetical protein